MPIDVMTQPGIRLELKDEGTGITTFCSVSLHDAKQLFGALRLIYRQEMQSDPSLFLTVPRISLDLTKYLPQDVIDSIPESPVQRLTNGSFEMPTEAAQFRERSEAKVVMVLKDAKTRVETRCRLTTKDAVQLYQSLREVFGDFERSRDELYQKPITCSVKAELQVFQPLPKVSGDNYG